MFLEREHSLCVPTMCVCFDFFPSAFLKEIKKTSFMYYQSKVGTCELHELGQKIQAYYHYERNLNILNVKSIK